MIPCLTKGISAGRFVDLVLASSRGAGAAPAATCRFNLEGGAGTRGDFLVGCPNALAASDAWFVTDRWFTSHLSVFARFRIDAWMADVACPVVCHPVWPANVGWILLTGPPRLLLVLSRDVLDENRDELGVVPDDVVLALRDAASQVFCR